MEFISSGCQTHAARSTVSILCAAPPWGGNTTDRVGGDCGKRIEALSTAVHGHLQRARWQSMMANNALGADSGATWTRCARNELRARQRGLAASADVQIRR